MLTEHVTVQRVHEAMSNCLMLLDLKLFQLSIVATFVHQMDPHTFDLSLCASLQHALLNLQSIIRH